MGVAAKLQQEWSKRGVKVIGLSVDGLEDHGRSIANINETQHARVTFPIIADKDREASMLLGLLDSTTFRPRPSLGETLTVRSVFIISPPRRAELILSYPVAVGRNFEAILRVIDALQLSSRHKVATPANWQRGEDTMVLPFVTDDEAELMFADKGGIRKVRSHTSAWYAITPCASPKRCAGSQLGAQATALEPWRTKEYDLATESMRQSRLSSHYFRCDPEASSLRRLPS